MKVCCPTCNKLMTWKENPWRPFCSGICKLMDLGRWASEEYRIPVTEEDEEKTEEVKD